MNIKDRNEVGSDVDRSISHPKTVRQVEAALGALGVPYCVHHTLFLFPMPRAITVASAKRIDVAYLNACAFNIARAIIRGDVTNDMSVGAFVKCELAAYGYHYVAVCSRGDVFDQTRGETIAFGRLLKAQRKHIMSGYRRLPALSSRRRDTRCVPLPRKLHEGTTQDVVIGCGQSLADHASKNPAHFMFCCDCSYMYSNEPDSKCMRYRAVYGLISPRHIIRAYEAEDE